MTIVRIHGIFHNPQDQDKVRQEALKIAENLSTAIRDQVFIETIKGTIENHEGKTTSYAEILVNCVDRRVYMEKLQRAFSALGMPVICVPA